MKVTIYVEPDHEAPKDFPQVIVSSRHPEVICTVSSENKSMGIDHVKGACLHAIGDYEHVPDVVEFQVVEKVRVK